MVLHVILFIAVILVAALAVVPAHTLRDVSPSSCMPAPQDYVRVRRKSHILSIDTGRYSAVVDLDEVAIFRMGVVPGTGGEEGDGHVAASLPPARLNLAVRLGRALYRCAGALHDSGERGVSVWASGRFVQRVEIAGLVFRDRHGCELRAASRLEIVAWPDCLALGLEVRPAALARLPGWRQASARLRLTSGNRTFEAVGHPSAPSDGLEAWARLDPVAGRTEIEGPGHVRVTAGGSQGPARVWFDANRGCHHVAVDRASPPGRMRIVVENAGALGRMVRLALDECETTVNGDRCTDAESTPILVDVDGYPTGIPVQVSTYCAHEPGGSIAGYALLHLPPHSRVVLGLVWSATGAPLLERIARAAGGARWLAWTAEDGKAMLPESVTSATVRQGPVLAEEVHAGALMGDAVRYRVTVSTCRSDDVLRVIYRVTMRVLRRVRLKRLAIFGVAAGTETGASARKIAVGNADGMACEWAVEPDASRCPDAVELTGRLPWVSLHEAVPTDPAATCSNHGIVIRYWTARLGGHGALPWLAAPDAAAYVDIVVPPAVHELLPGDYVEATLEHVTIPRLARDYRGENRPLLESLLTSENTWRMVHRETVGNEVAAAATQGAVVAMLPIRVLASRDGSAAFSLTGGLGWRSVTLVGLRAPRVPMLKARSVDGAWHAVEPVAGEPVRWQADFDASTQTWEVTYALPMDAPGGERATRGFRFRMLSEMVCVT